MKLTKEQLQKANRLKGLVDANKKVMNEIRDHKVKTIKMVKLRAEIRDEIDVVFTELLESGIIIWDLVKLFGRKYEYSLYPIAKRLSPNLEEEPKK